MGTLTFGWDPQPCGRLCSSPSFLLLLLGQVLKTVGALACLILSLLAPRTPQRQLPQLPQRPRPSLACLDSGSYPTAEDCLVLGFSVGVQNLAETPQQGSCAAGRVGNRGIVQKLQSPVENQRTQKNAVPTRIVKINWLTNI